MRPRKRHVQLKTKNLLAVFCNLFNNKEVRKVVNILIQSFSQFSRQVSLKITLLLSENYPWIEFINNLSSHPNADTKT